MKAKKYVQSWTTKGFLTNYQDETGEIYYELSLHSSKTLGLAFKPKKRGICGSRIKFKNIFNQLVNLLSLPMKILKNEYNYSKTKNWK
ncbi:MAG: DUF3375 family protein [Bacteroidetes bacterium]|nr:DUF3375 family protein [Bacteroidota bacterium]